MPSHRLSRRSLLSSGAALAASIGSRSARADRPTIRIGVLTDLSGGYKDTGGPSSVAAVRQAVSDFGDRGFDVTVVSADHQQKADIGASIVRQWFDQDGVDMVTEVNNSAIAFAVNSIVFEKDKVQLNTGAVSSDMTGKSCGPNLVAWMADTWEASSSVVINTVAAGGKTWYILVPNYTFGLAAKRDAEQAVVKRGGSVIGSASYPFPDTTDFSPFLLQAQASGAQVIGLGAGGIDLSACLKQAAEFKIGRGDGIKLVALGTHLQDIHSAGLEVAQGLGLVQTFYWDLNDKTRAFAKRVVARAPGNCPNQEHAAGYSATLHYLKVVEQLGVAQAKASGRGTIAAMKRTPTDDDCFGPARIREDGRFMCPVHAFQVKTPNESRSEWDLFRFVGTVPPDEAWRPIADGGCKMATG